MSNSEVVKKEKRTKKEKRDKSSRLAGKTVQDNEDAVMSDVAPEISKKEKRAKKEKKEEFKVVEEGSDAIDVDVEDKPSDEPSSTKKRKREALADELEIDISLPEPPSKKAARKAKKAKSTPTTANGTTEASTTEITGTVTGATDGAGKRSEYGVWIGNLPWSATRDLLITFLTSNSDITTKDITRVHLPPPTKPVNPSWTFKPLNKGFAYVDFATQLAMYSAIALTETKMDGRALLIKNAKSFEGRPEKPKAEEVGTDGKVKAGHPPNKRVFVGNLAFEVTKEDLETHYRQCGEILDTHMATFEDSGKCKGYAWITFEDVDAATNAVRGYVFKDEKDIKKKKAKDDDPDSESEPESDAKKKKQKQRKWLVNKLKGRDLRCEFAEDSTIRYNKRHGKKKEDVDTAVMSGLHPDRVRQLETEAPFERPVRANRPFKPRPKVDARTIPSGKAHANAPRASHAIVKGQGKKTSFD